MKEIKKRIKALLGIPNTLYNFFLLKYRNVEYGNNLKISGRLWCVSNSKEGIKIGNNVTINSCLPSNPIGGDVKTILFAKGQGKIQIGDNCGISNSTIFATDSIILEDAVYIGGSTHIYDTDFHWIELERRIRESGGESKPVRIKSGAFIGAGCTILKGVTIGEEAVIGAGSIVTKNIPAREIWAGNPAKFIKKIS